MTYWFGITNYNSATWGNKFEGKILNICWSLLRLCLHTLPWTLALNPDVVFLSLNCIPSSSPALKGRRWYYWLISFPFIIWMDSAVHYLKYKCLKYIVKIHRCILYFKSNCNIIFCVCIWNSFWFVFMF